jgi:G3E family GTPase
MVRAAQREQVVRLVVTSVFPRAKMMHVDEGGVPTTRYLAAMLIAQQHRATNSRRNRLRSALTVEELEVSSWQLAVLAFSRGSAWSHLSAARSKPGF